MSVLAVVVGVKPLGSIAATALLMYLCLQAWRLPRMGQIVLASALVSSAVCAAYIPNPWTVFESALELGCFFVSVLLSGGFLREAADRSAMVHAAGNALIAQAPARRNAALSFGAFAMGFILSFGTLQLLGSMVERANTLASANGDVSVQATRLRRSMLAVLRGFCMSTVCNPISIVMALALTYSPGAQWRTVMFIVVPSALVLLVFGGILDWWSGPRTSQTTSVQAPSLRPVARLVMLVIGVISAVLLVSSLFEIAVIHAVVVTVPVIAVAWIAIQHRGRLGAIVARLEWQAVTRFPAQRVEVTILASAGVAGAFLAAALPVDAIAAMVRTWSLPAIVLPLLVFWFMYLGAQLAMNPILTAAIAGAILPAPLMLGTPPEAVAVAYMAAWGVGTCASPFTLSVLIIAGIAKQDSRVIAWRWNRVFALGAACLVSVLLCALAVFG